MNLPFAKDETIAAIATAVSLGHGGIAIIRISGPSAVETVKGIIHTPGRQHWESHKVLYGYVMDENKKKRIDEVLILFMQAPRSFTGEDVVELHCHGGLVVVETVLERVLASNKVRRASPGEFSQRAVLNGRLDLTQAESINQLISARSHRAADFSINGLDGGVGKKITSLRQILLDQLSEIEARIDFEEDLPQLNEKSLLDELNKVMLDLQTLIKDSKRGAYIHQGLKVALIGVPNVGKSSLLNLLSRRNRAIVTDSPGTTRDLLESEILLKGVPITLVDTAGIRSSNDRVEQIGIKRSKEALIKADIIVLIFDLSIGWTKADQRLLDSIPDSIPCILVANKSDIPINKSHHLPLKQPIEKSTWIELSAVTGEGEDLLIDALLRTYGVNDLKNLEVILNERQLELARLAYQALSRIQDVANEELPWDFWTIDLREAIQKLGELTGEEITEAVLDRIFARFCIGK